MNLKEQEILNDTNKKAIYVAHKETAPQNKGYMISEGLEKDI